MKIEKIIIVQRIYAPDTVYLFTNLPSQYPKEISTQNLYLSFTCPKNTALKYCDIYFPNLSIEICKDD